MNTYRFNKRCLYYFSFLIILLVLLFTSISLLNLQNYTSLAILDRSNSYENIRHTIYTGMNRINLSVLPQDHSLKDIRITRPTNSRFFEGHKLECGKLDSFKFTFFCATLLFIYCFLCLTRKSNKRISVVALLLGSHAPPQLSI